MAPKAQLVPQAQPAQPARRAQPDRKDKRAQQVLRAQRDHRDRQGRAGGKVYFATLDWLHQVSFRRDQVFHTVLTKDVPAGSYTAQMNALAIGQTESAVDVECRLPGAETFKEAGDYYSRQIDLSITTAFVHPGGPVELSCRGNGGDPNAWIIIRVPTLLLTEVASVN